jgi:hypothetical protein
MPDLDLDLHERTLEEYSQQELDEYSARYTIRGVGYGGPTAQQVRTIEADGSPMFHDTLPIRLETLVEAIRSLDRASQDQWRLVQELPEYVRRDKRAIEEQGIQLIPRLHGPHQSKGDRWLRWDVSSHDTDDRSQMGSIAAFSRTSGRVFIEYWLGGFPDQATYTDLMWAIHESIFDVLRSRLDGTPPAAPLLQHTPAREPRALLVPGAPRKRGKNIDTAIKVAKARLIIERKGHKITQRTACDLAGVSPKTFRKYRDDPDVITEMERLRKDNHFQEEIEGI